MSRRLRRTQLAGRQERDPTYTAVTYSSGSSVTATRQVRRAKRPGGPLQAKIARRIDLVAAKLVSRIPPGEPHDVPETGDHADEREQLGDSLAHPRRKGVGHSPAEGLVSVDQDQQGVSSGIAMVTQLK